MNMVAIRTLVILIGCAVLATQPVLADLPAGMQKITTVEGITEYSLPNGLQVLLFPDPSKPTFTVNVTYRVGSRHEGRGEAGMAHLLEHMVFKGTPTFPHIWKALQDHGASFNGTTWLDRTNYYETLPTNDDNLDFALKMEADRMVNSDIAAEELEKEMPVVRNEFERGENSPTAVLSERIMSSAYLWHNYGKSTIGNRSDIERVPVDKLKEFYKKYYQPDNATLIVAGQFDEPRVLDLIGKYFGAIGRPDRVLDDTYTEEPPQDGARLVTLKRAGDVAAVGAVYHIPAGTHPDFPAISLLSDVLTNQPAGRLYRGLVTPGMASRVSSFAYPLAEPGVIELSATVTDGQIPEAVLDYMVTAVESLNDITDEEVERARAKTLKALKLAMTDSSRVGVRLSEFIAQGDWRLLFIQRDRIQEVTRDQVQAVADKVLHRKQSHRRDVHSRGGNPACYRSGCAGTGRAGQAIRYAATDRGRRGDQTGCGLHRVAYRAHRTAVRHQSRSAALPDAGRFGSFVCPAALRYRGFAERADHRSEPDPGHADAGHPEPHLSATER